MTEEYWSWPARIVFGVGGAVAAAAAGAMLMGLVDGTALEYPGLAVFVALVAYYGWRGATVRVTADSKQIVVRNLLRTVVIRRADVLRVRDRRLPWTRNEQPCPTVFVRGRRRPVQLLAMTPFGFPPNPRFVSAVKRWNGR